MNFKMIKYFFAEIKKKYYFLL